jgi:hypothetical protein
LPGVLCLLSFTGLTAGACTSDSQSTMTAATDEDYDDIASSLATAVAHEGDEVAAMRAAASLARGSVPAGLAPTSTGAFTGSAAGLDYHYQLACTTDSAAAPCAPSTTGAAVQSSWSSDLELPELAMTLSHDASWQLTGLTPSIAHVAGTGSLTYDTRDSTQTYHYHYDASYHVVIDDTRAIGGGISLAITATRSEAATRQQFAITGELTFSPDDTADLVLDGSHHYRILLATGAVTPATAAEPAITTAMR